MSTFLKFFQTTYRNRFWALASTGGVQLQGGTVTQAPTPPTARGGWMPASEQSRLCMRDASSAAENGDGGRVACNTICEAPWCFAS